MFHALCRVSRSISACRRKIALFIIQIHHPDEIISPAAPGVFDLNEAGSVSDVLVIGSRAMEPEQRHPRRADIMRSSTISSLALIFMAVARAHAQSYRTAQQQAHAARQAEIRRQNYAKQEAVRLLFSPQGIPALTRPSDPWNYNRPRYYNRPSYIRNQYRAYYR
jgi:hypothetical protein